MRLFRFARALACGYFLACIPAHAGAPGSFADVTCNHEGSPWYSLTVKTEISGEAIPGLEVISKDRVHKGVLMETSALSYIGNDPIILLNPVQARFAGEFEGRTSWANRFKEKINSDILAMLASEAMQPGAFESERSIRFFVEKFQSLPGVKMVNDIGAGPGYWESIAAGLTNDYWSRKWRKLEHGFDWGYDELSLFPVPDEDGRPKDISPPAPVRTVTDVGLIKGRPIFFTKTATFSLNDRYQDGTKARASDPDCQRKHDQATIEKNRPAYLGKPIYVGSGVFGVFMAVAFYMRKRSKVILRKR